MPKDRSFQGIEITNQRLKRLEKVLLTLRELTEGFCLRFQNDAPYWYNERANVSFLAGAIWRCGGMCLEEYAAEKIWEKELYPGQTDIWFYLDGKQYIVEAKFDWVEIPGDNAGIEAKIKVLVDDAVKDARNNPDQADMKLGMAFVVPYIKTDIENIEDRITELISLIKAGTRYDILAPVFPVASRNLDYQGHLYPGMIVLARCLA